MTIREIYTKYKINKGLREHMLAVSSVAKMICDNSTLELNTETIVSASLLHDMGNLIKSKLDIFQDQFEPEGLEYWGKVKTEMHEKYGDDEHEATKTMVKEITNSQNIIDLVTGDPFENVSEVIKTGNINVKIELYSDLRVGPHGILSLDDRLDDIKERYVPLRFTPQGIEERRVSMKEIEKEIFENSKISPEDITDESTKEIQKELENWVISA